jgi:hypothetical protein
MRASVQEVEVREVIGAAGILRVRIDRDRLDPDVVAGRQVDLVPSEREVQLGSRSFRSTLNLSAISPLRPEYLWVSANR